MFLLGYILQVTFVCDLWFLQAEPKPNKIKLKDFVWYQHAGDCCYQIPAHTNRTKIRLYLVGRDAGVRKWEMNEEWRNEHIHTQTETTTCLFAFLNWGNAHCVECEDSLTQSVWHLRLFMVYQRRSLSVILLLVLSAGVRCVVPTCLSVVVKKKLFDLKPTLWGKCS